MTTVDTVVIGAGHAGLAVSRLLTAAGRDHLVLDRGRIAERWRSERWDSLRLLSPNWMTRLPGWQYSGNDEDGFMSAGQFVRYLESYAESFEAPVQARTTVEEVSAEGRGYRVTTDRGSWRASSLVIATGPWEVPVMPAGLRDAGGLNVVAANSYRSPGLLAPGGVLVVGASSSGVQLADELARAGRHVVLAVGRHTRMPRRYRGMDTFWWLERTGRLARTIDQVRDLDAARAEPSMQLVGRTPSSSHDAEMDLTALQSRGVQLVGRLQSVDRRGVAHFRDDLKATVAAADQVMQRFLDSVDAHIDATGLTEEVWPPRRPRPVVVPAAPKRAVDLVGAGITNVVVAAGYRPSYPWLRLPILERDGTIGQYRGVTSAPGVYVVGQRFQHRRDSSMIDGARHDARAVVAHLSTGSVDSAPVHGGGR